MKTLELKINDNSMLDVIGNVTSPFVVLSELIKNGVDANAKSVTVHIDTLKNTIKVIDNGDGFNLSDIEDLGTAALSSKKRGSYVFNNNGEMLLGSKGLAFFSVFSLGDELQIKTKNKKNECFYIEWNRNANYLNYEQVYDTNYTLGTEILISGIDEDNIILLSSEKELNKFKHISLVNFQENPNIPKVILVKDGKQFNVEVENINSFKEDFDAQVTFSYDENNDSLKYRYEVSDERITNKELIIDLKTGINSDQILKDNYNIIPVPISFDDYLTTGLIERKEIVVPSFEGKWFMKRGHKNAKMKTFESGIKLYVNNFALYNYLNKNNDWLQLTNISQVKKINNFRQHNVFGYVNFTNFNDLKEGLKISNERGGFIENIYYHKFIDLLYMYVLYITISIDYARKNNHFYNTDRPGTSGPGTSGPGTSGPGTSGPGTSGPGTSGPGTSGPGTSGPGTSGPGTSGPGTSGPGTSGPGTSGPGTSGPGTSGPGTSGPGTDEDNGEKIKDRILKATKIKIPSGENVYLLDPTIINAKYSDDLFVMPRGATQISERIFKSNNMHGEFLFDYFSGDLKETLSIIVVERKITGIQKENEEFFKSSNHFIGDIDLSDISHLVRQLLGLNYEEKYLLFVISFRAILEDIVKKYILARPHLALTGIFKDNITTMLSDMQNVLSIQKNDLLKNEKLAIKEIFKGHEALNNFLVGINVKFMNDNYDKFLHSLTHNPTKIDKSLAIEIANDMILPLYILAKLLKDKNII